jgi:hypothetical protein
LDQNVPLALAHINFLEQMRPKVIEVPAAKFKSGLEQFVGPEQWVEELNEPIVPIGFIFFDAGQPFLVQKSQNRINQLPFPTSAFLIGPNIQILSNRALGQIGFELQHL